LLLEPVLLKEKSIRSTWLEMPYGPYFMLMTKNLSMKMFARYLLYSLFSLHVLLCQRLMFLLMSKVAPFHISVYSGHADHHSDDVDYPLDD